MLVLLELLVNGSIVVRVLEELFISCVIAGVVGNVDERRTLALV